MVMDVTQTYCDNFAIYANIIKSGCIPEMKLISLNFKKEFQLKKKKKKRAN